MWIPLPASTRGLSSQEWEEGYAHDLKIEKEKKNV